MTAANIQNALVKRLEEVLKDFPFKTSYNDPTPFKIFRHKVPEKMNDEFDYDEEGTHKLLYPFCVVQIDNGSKEGNQDMQNTVINLIIGVKNESDEGEGYDDVMACIEAVWGDFNDNPLLNQRYPFKYPLEWSLLTEEDRHPFYFGGMQLTFESHSITDQRQGGFLHGQ